MAAAVRTRGDVRRLARVRPDLDLRESRVDRDQAARRPAGRLPLRARAARGLRRSAWRPARRSAAASRRSRSCTRRPVSATPSARSRPRASTARRSSSSSASRIAVTSRRSRSWRASCAASRASTRCGSTSPCGRRTCPARSPARSTRPSTARGPALVIVPMDDWLAEADPAGERAAPRRVSRARASEPAIVAELAALVAGAERPALVVGAGADEPATWAALVALAERLVCPVWQESFSSRAGFPQDHRLFAGHLPADRTRLREMLAPHDLVLAVGAPVVPPVPVHPRPVRSRGHARRGGQRRPGGGASQHGRARRARVARRRLRRARAGSCRRATGEPPRDRRPPGAAGACRAAGEPMRAAHVFAAMAERLPRDAIVIEESPSSRPDLLVHLPARESLGSLSPAMGGLGFALPAAIGLRMALPERPVVAIVGDGSSLYSIQALWSAAQYHAGALFVILANGGYAIMDRLAEQSGGTPPVAGLQRRRRRPRARARLPLAQGARARGAARGAGRGAAGARPARRAAAARGRGRRRTRRFAP